MKASIIIPAFNEAERIGSVLNPAQHASLVDEIIVVNDGSTDDTEKRVRSYPRIKIMNSLSNKSRYSAMECGVNIAANPVICFIDAYPLI